MQYYFNKSKMKIVKSLYLNIKSLFNFDDSWYTTADLELGVSQMTKYGCFNKQFEMADGHHIENRFSAVSNSTDDCTTSVKFCVGSSFFSEFLQHVRHPRSTERFSCFRYIRILNISALTIDWLVSATPFNRLNGIVFVPTTSSMYNI